MTAVLAGHAAGGVPRPDQFLAAHRLHGVAEEPDDHTTMVACPVGHGTSGLRPVQPHRVGVGSGTNTGIPGRPHYLVLPSIRSRRRSAWPLCWAYSPSMWR
jgi:hypothetical protein